MTFGFIQGASAFTLVNGTSLAVAMPGSVTAGSTLVLIARLGNDGVTISGASDNINGNYTQQISRDQTIDGDRLLVYYFPNAASGTPTYTLTISASASINLGFIEAGLVATSSPVDQSNSADYTVAGTSFSSSSITTLNANDYMIAAISSDGTGNAGADFTDSAGWTNRFAINPAGVPGGPSRLYISDRIVSATGTYSDTFTSPVSITSATAIIALKQLDAITTAGNPIFRVNTSAWAQKWA